MDNIDHTLKLPIEIAQHILSFLNERDILNMAQVSQFWNSTVNSHNLLWKQICENKRITDKPSRDLTSWKSIYVRNTRIHLNWMREPLKCHEFKADVSSECRLGLSGRNVLQILKGDYIRVWSVPSDECVFEYKERRDYIVRFSIKGHWIVTGNADGLIKVFSLETKTCKHILRGHEEIIIDLKVQDDRIFSMANDIRIWNLVKGECDQVLPGYNGYDMAIYSENDYLYNITLFDIVIWKFDQEYNNYRLAATIDYSSVMNSGLLMVKDNKIIRYWHGGNDEVSANLIHIKEPFGKQPLDFIALHHMQFPMVFDHTENSLAYSNFENSLTIIDINTKNKNERYGEKIGRICCLKIILGYVVLATTSGEVQVRSLKTAGLLRTICKLQTKYEIEQLEVTETKIMFRAEFSHKIATYLYDFDIYD